GGIYNAAFGTFALQNNVHADNNTDVGNFSLRDYDNTATGGAYNNTGVSCPGLPYNIIGAANTAVCRNAHQSNANVNNADVVDTAGFNITGDNNICIVSNISGFAGEFDTIRIGDNFIPILGSTSKTFIGGIFGANVTALSSLVFVNASGQLGTIPSSARF